MRSMLLAAMLALAGHPAFAQSADEAPAGAYVADRTHASVQWSALHEGIAWYHGRFTGFDVHLDFDPADVTKSKVTATIDPRSVETDFARTRRAGNTTDFNALIARNFFRAEQFPSIAFTSTAIVRTGDNTGRMTGNLTLRGVTKPVTLDVAYIGKGVRAQRWKVGFSATGSIRRSDFGVATTAVANEVRIAIDGEFIQK